MKVIGALVFPLVLCSMTMSVNPFSTDTNLILEEDILGFNGHTMGLQLGVFQKELHQPYIRGIFEISKGKLFRYGEPKAPLYQTTLEGQVGYSLPLNRRDVFRFNPFLGLGAYFQKLLNWDKTALIYLPFGLGVDYHLGDYFTLSAIGTALAQIQAFREARETGFFKKIPSSIGYRLEIPASLSLDPYGYVTVGIIPFYEYVPFGAPPFSPLLNTKTELQQIGFRVGVDAQF
ncbi:MAG: hypothetical protein KGQ54_03955 [Verrucomicrobia bacterium]|nr:hypothetical protein [Verrucomicrobiota bacterium]NDE63756.1 hypothetical protein [Chlamydiota bacterium]